MGLMKKVVINLLKKALLRNEEGASAVEYGLLLVFIAAVIIASVTLFGGSVEGLFKTTNTALNK